MQAALCPPDAAYRALKQWQALGGEEDRRLLPLIYANLQSRIDDPTFCSKVKLEYVRTWSMNRLFFHLLFELLNLFRDAGIPTLLLKGSALTLAHARDRGVRPMNDIDVLIPTAQAKQGIGLMEATGWKPESRGFERFTDAYVGIAHSHPFRRGESYECDLHWHVLPECCRPDDDHEFWEASDPVDVDGIVTRTLSPADQVLHSCAHGARWNHRRSVQWLADVMIVLRNSPTISWPRLVEQTRKRRLSLRVHTTLGYLAQHLDAPIPADVLAELENIPVSRMDRWEHEYQLVDHEPRAFGYVPMLWFYHRRWQRDATLLGQVFGFPDYLRRYWGGEGARELAGHFSATARRRLVHWLDVWRATGR